MSVAYQDIVKVGKRADYNTDNLFCRIHLDALQEAMQNLKGESLKLWLYISKNQDGFQFDLSQKALEEWGLKKDAYYTAKNKLKELGYLKPIKEGSNIYVFCEKIGNSEKPKEKSADSEKQKNLSEKPKDFSEKQKSSSEKAFRNTTILHNTTIKENNSSLQAELFSKEVPKEKEEGTKENPIVVSKEWLVARSNNIIRLANGDFKHWDKFYRMGGAAND